MTTVQKDILSKAIGTAARAVGANPVIPLLSNILLESSNGSSRVAGTNLEIGISYRFPSKGKAFKTCVPARTIASLMDALQADEVELKLDPKNQSIAVMTESSTSNIHCAPAEEFPDIPTVKKATFSVNVVQFKEMVQRVAFAASRSDNNPVLAGVQLSITGSQLIMFAVDGFHFSYEETELAEEVKESVSFIVKGVTLEMISRILPEEGDLDVEVTENKAMFHCGDVDVITQLFDGKFPEYERLHAAIPKAKTTLTVATKDLLQACKQLRVFAIDTGNSLFDVQGMLVRFSVVAQEKGASDITFPAMRKGEDVKIGINVHNLYEFLEICGTEYVTIAMAGPQSPILFRMKGFKTYYHVIMPIVL
jgi:DNA polymerase-3 subunit beta